MSPVIDYGKYIPESGWVANTVWRNVIEKTEELIEGQASEKCIEKGLHRADLQIETENKIIGIGFL